MKLVDLASQYVAYKQGMGMRFNTEARILKSFCRAMGDIGADDAVADLDFALKPVGQVRGAIACFAKIVADRFVKMGGNLPKIDRQIDVD